MNPRIIFRNVCSSLARRAAHSYVVGTKAADALPACRSLRKQGVGTTLCYWNSQQDEPGDTLREYLTTLDVLAADRLDSYLSVKAPPLAYDRNAFGQIFERAQRAHIGVHFDALSPDTAGEIFALINDFSARFPNIGCTLPARWRRSVMDAKHAVEQHLHVRVVKGQWADIDGSEIEPRSGFLRIIDQLKGHTATVRVATHDPELAANALSRLRQTGTSCELELLFGLPYRHMIPVARNVGVPTRIYIPYGHAWLPYALNQAKRNPKIAWWIMRDLLSRDPLPLSGFSR